MNAAGQGGTRGESWTWCRWHWGVLLAAVALRLAYALTLNTEQIFFGWDGKEFHAYAQSLLAGRGDDYPRFFNFTRAPGYSLFLLPFVALDAGNLRQVQCAQVLLGGWQVWVLALITARWAGQRAGNWALVLAAFNPFLIYYCALLMTECLFITLLWAGLAALQRLVPGPAATDPWRWTCWGGVALALGCLTRPGLQLLLPLAAVWIGWLAWRAAGAGPALARMAGFTAVVSALLLPWQTGHALAHGQFTLAPWHGQAVYFQTHTREYLETYEARTKEDYYRAFGQACRDISTEPHAVPREEWLPRARAFRREHADEWWRLQRHKFLHFWTPWLNPLIFPRVQVWVSILSQTPLFLLAFWELWRRMRHPDPFLVLLLAVLGTGLLVGGLLFLTAVRYRIPFVDVTFLVLTAGWLGRRNWWRTRTG
jgi:hypothetical protein